MASATGYILDLFLLGETPCCIRQWVDLWNAQWSELPVQLQGEEMGAI